MYPAGAWRGGERDRETGKAKRAPRERESKGRRLNPPRNLPSFLFMSALRFMSHSHAHSRGGFFMCCCIRCCIGH